jgi:hypothetical protein
MNGGPRARRVFFANKPTPATRNLQVPVKELESPHTPDGQTKSTLNSLRTSSPPKPPGSHAPASTIPANPKHAPTARQRNQRIKKTGRRNTSSSDASTPVLPPCHPAPRARRTAPSGPATTGKPTQTTVDSLPFMGSFPQASQRPLYIQLAYTLIPPICGTRPGTRPS